MIKRVIFYNLLFLILFFMSFNFISAKDLTNDFNIKKVEICASSKCVVLSGDNCPTEYNDNYEVGLYTSSKFFVKIYWEMNITDGVQAGDIVEFPFANEKNTDSTSAFMTSGFSATDIYDAAENKIGKWSINGNGTSRKINITFNSIGANTQKIEGVLITPENIKTNYTYVNKIIPLTVKDKVCKFKLYTKSYTESGTDSLMSVPSAGNDSAKITIVSPRITAKELYEIYNGSKNSLSNAAILNDLYYELTLNSDLDASIIDNGINFGISFLVPTDVSGTKASGNNYNFTVTNKFTKVEPEENEEYRDFKNRLKKFEYGIYNSDDGSKIIVVNFGNQPSSDEIYSAYLMEKYPDVSEMGTYFKNSNPFTFSDIEDIINGVCSIDNGIDGKIALWEMDIRLAFDPPVTSTTTKKISGRWSWTNKLGEKKTDQKTATIKLVVPDSAATVSSTSKLILRDYDSKNPIRNANIYLQNKNGEDYDDVGNAITNSSGLVEFSDLDDIRYRYFLKEEDYPDGYKTDSFKMYSDDSYSTEIDYFDFENSVGNVIYATIERKKYTVTYLPGDHGTFEDKIFKNILYGEPTPDYEPVGDDGWIFKGWDKERDIFVYENKTYEATWKKMVKVTTKYLEVGTNKSLLEDVVDIKENGEEYTTLQKDIDNYDFVRVEGNESGVRGEDDIVVTYYYKKKEANLHIKYLDCSTRGYIASDTNQIVYYGDSYNADNYEASVVIPDNYYRVAASKSSNYRGTVDSDSINVEYCYNKKDSVINTSVAKSGTDRIVSSNDRVTYQINYNATFTDYIGNANIIVTDTLPYKIDVNNSNLDGGIYNDNNKTITWNMNTYINSYSSSEYSITKNIELSYINLDKTGNEITNNVISRTVIDDKDVSAETNYNTFVDIKGTITVKYLENDTFKELLDTIVTTDKVGKEYELINKDIEGYKLVSKPDEDSYKYKEESQEFKYIYERIKYKIKVTSNEGGKVSGDEEVYYNEDSTDDNIKIEASEGYIIKSITINDKDIKILENQTNLTIPKFTNMKEDKNIHVIFEMIGENAIVPDTKGGVSLVLIIIGSLTIALSTFITLRNRKVLSTK